MALGTTAFQFETLNGTNFRTVTVNDVARGPLNEALTAPPITGGPKLQPCQSSGKSGPVYVTSYMPRRCGFVAQFVERRVVYRPRQIEVVEFRLVMRVDNKQHRG